MNKTTQGTKDTQKDKGIVKPKWIKTEEIKHPQAYYRTKEQWKAINDGQSICPNCKQQVLEADAMEAPSGELIHEACWEPGAGE